MEIVSTILYQLTRNLTPEQIKAQGFDTYFVDHTTGVYPQAASGMPFSTSTLQVTGDALADLFEDMAAEQKARLTYDNILRLAADNPEVKDVIRFLREREIVHFQRFGEAVRPRLNAFSHKGKARGHRPLFSSILETCSSASRISGSPGCILSACRSSRKALSRSPCTIRQRPAW